MDRILLKLLENIFYLLHTIHNQKKYVTILNHFLTYANIYVIFIMIDGKILLNMRKTLL